MTTDKTMATIQCATSNTNTVQTVFHQRIHSFFERGAERRGREDRSEGERFCWPWLPSSRWPCSTLLTTQPRLLRRRYIRTVFLFRFLSKHSSPCGLRTSGSSQNPPTLQSSYSSRQTRCKDCTMSSGLPTSLALVIRNL